MCRYRIHTYIKTTNSIEDILSFFRGLNSVFLELLKIPNTPQDFAIDFHNEGYYGDKNAEGVRGIQPKNGASWGYVYFTIDWLGSPTHTFDIVNVTGLNKDYAALVEGVVQRIRAMGLQIRKILEDRELFNLATILKFYELGADFIMAAKIDKRIKKLLGRHKRENGGNPRYLSTNSRMNGALNFIWWRYQIPIMIPPCVRERETGIFISSLPALLSDPLRRS